MTRRRSVTATHRSEPVLGSRLDISVSAGSGFVARRAIGFATDELERWEHLLSAYRPSSELRRWIDGDLADRDTSAELAAVVRRTRHWEEATLGCVSPFPGDRSTSGFEIDDAGRPHRTGDLADLRVDAFAKGYIVDRVVEATSNRRGVVDVMINVGGDLRAAGPSSISVGIEHPGRPFDNEPPIATVEIANAACATSGRSRRGDHLLDGRTGSAIEFTGSVVVCADTLEEADVWATALCIDHSLPVPAGVRPRLLDIPQADRGVISHPG